MEQIVALLAKHFKTLGVGGVIVVMLSAAVYVYAPEFLKIYSTNSKISRDDSYLDVVQKIYYYNEFTIDGLRTILIQHNPVDESNEQTVELKTKNVLGATIPISLPEMNRMPYCIDDVGNKYIKILDRASMENQAVDIMVLREMNIESKLELIAQILKSFQRSATEELKGDMATCTK